MGQAILTMEKMTKIYSNGIVANKDVDFSIEAGEIHALMGENGAGKSTLMKILFGEEQFDSGTITLRGKEIKIANPQQAIEHGIGMVHQHFMLIPSLTVAENVFLGMSPKKYGFLDKQAAIDKCTELAEKYNFNVDPKAVVGDISVGTKQKVEIMKALARGAKILILDEPTAVLAPQETEELFKELLLFKESGHTIIFISHKLKEIKQICDRITIMKKGRSVGVYDLENMDEKDISRLMVGRDAIGSIQKEKATPGGTVLEIKDVVYSDEEKTRLKNVSARVRAGEIMGVAGVEGNGQQEFAQAIAGLVKISTGEITLNGESVVNTSIHRIREMGLSYVSDDRISEGSAGESSIQDNMIGNKMADKTLTWGPFLKSKAIEELAQKLVKDYDVVCDSPEMPVSMLSGGNMQKVVVAREFSSHPKLLLVNQPTRGVDVGAMEFIHNKIVALRDDNTAVLMISADLNEILTLSDSLLVFYDGEIVAYFESLEGVSEEEIGFYMLGVKTQSPEDIKERLMYGSSQ